MKLTHGGDIYSHKNKFARLIDFSANINPLGIPSNVIKAAKESIDFSTAYPDPLCRELKEAVCKDIAVNTEHIIFGNGAADVVFRLVTALKPKKALILAPTFAEYELALATVHSSVDYYMLKEEDNFEIKEDILEYITEDVDIVFICNPNNPTGVLTPKSIMVKILEKCKTTGTFFVADECFNDFLEDKAENTLIDLLLEYKNLFILKAFTKIYAIPGIRLGFGICSDVDLLEKIYLSGQAWSVSTIAQATGVACVKEKEYLIKTAEYISKERAYLIKELKNLGFKIYGSKANYIFFKSSYSIDIKEELAKEGILIRGCDNYKGLDNSYFRIGVKTTEENQIIINKFKEKLNK